jgi:hypothetical protein
MEKKHQITEKQLAFFRAVFKEIQTLVKLTLWN